MSRLDCNDVKLMTLRAIDENTIFNIEQDIYNLAREGKFNIEFNISQYPYMKNLMFVCSYFKIKGYRVVPKFKNDTIDSVLIYWDFDLFQI